MIRRRCRQPRHLNHSRALEDASRITGLRTDRAENERGRTRRDTPKALGITRDSMRYLVSGRVASSAVQSPLIGPISSLIVPMNRRTNAMSPKVPARLA